MITVSYENVYEDHVIGYHLDVTVTTALFDCLRQFSLLCHPSSFILPVSIIARRERIVYQHFT